MATQAEVAKLAALARIHLPEGELATFTKEFDAILAYVGQLDGLTLPVDTDREVPKLRNVMRADGEPHAPSLHTEKLAEQFPAREGDALSVKQIISHE